MDLFKLSSEDDSNMLAILLNCINKLPNFIEMEQVGEMELTTNYLDPIFSPLFHQPEINRHFIWLNRTDKNTENLRPDGVMRYANHKSFNITLGFCEVKASDCKSSLSLCSDLLRSASFFKSSMLRKKNKLTVCILAVGKRKI